MGVRVIPAAQTLTYDPATGDPATISAAGKTITSTTDQLGRDLTYTDATGLKTSYQYDKLDRPAKQIQADTAAGGITRTFATTTTYDYYTGTLSAQTDPQTGTTSAAYDSAGNLSTQTQGATSAGGLTVTSKFDTTGDQVQRAWTMTGQPNPVLTETAVANIHGQQTDHSMMPGRDLTYTDATGRLTSVTDRDAGQCTTRAYRFDVNSNRTGYAATTTPATNDTAGNPTVCPAPAAPAATTTFDTGDRITTTGHSYDAYGRTTRLPLTGGAVMRVAYHANDLVAAQTTYATAADADANNGAGTNPTDTSTYTLDITAQRVATRTAQTTHPTTTLTRTNRYGNSSDSPAWTNEGDGTTTRTIPGATGDLAAITTLTNTDTTGASDQISWQLTNLHGDISATLPADTALPIQINRTDEYGAPITGGTTPRYSWLGAKQRASDTPGGIILMGVRLYNPGTGRFLITDPIYGGNANTYTYPVDPINQYDLSGQSSTQGGGGGCDRTCQWKTKVARIAKAVAWASDKLGWIPKWICGWCALASTVLAALAFVLYVVIGWYRTATRILVTHAIGYLGGGHMATRHIGKHLRSGTKVRALIVKKFGPSFLNMILSSI
jgi:RHS repeat-associated protein